MNNLQTYISITHFEMSKLLIELEAKKNLLKIVMSDFWLMKLTFDIAKMKRHLT